MCRQLSIGSSVGGVARITLDYQNPLFSYLVCNFLLFIKFENLDEKQEIKLQI